MSLIREFKAELPHQSITLQWSFIKRLRRHAITGLYEVSGQELVRTTPYTTRNPGLGTFREVLRRLLENIEIQQKERGRSIQDVMSLLALSDDINAKLSAWFGI